MWDNYEPPRPRFYRRPWFFAMLAVPALAVLAGLLYVKSVEMHFEKRAAEFDLKKLEEMESASTIYDRSGTVIGRLFLENRDTVPLRDLPYELVQALVAAEDNRFFQHHGVDYYGMARAALKNWRAHGIKQGASTITQQLARNTFGLHERTYERKMTEIFLARRIEEHYGADAKTKVLELYLNRVYFGAGFYGVEAAARGYFGKPAKDLNLSECATLCGLLKNPNSLSPWTNRQACIESRNYVLGRMLDLKIISSGEYKKVVAQNLAVKNRRTFHADSYALDMVRQQVDEILGRGEANSGGYKIYTTLDAQLQKMAEQRLQQQLRSIEERQGYEHPRFEQFDAMFRQRARKNENDSAMPVPDYLQGALVAIDNATGGVLALIGGRDFAHSQYNRVTQSLRPTGTAFTPFVFAAGLDRGMFLGQSVQDAAIDNRQVMIGGVTGILGEWGPERADNRYEGAIPARAALVNSKNAATVRFGMQVGVDNVLALAKNAGLARVVGKEKSTGESLLNLRAYPSTFLGSSEMTLMDMALAYTIFPDGGRRPNKPLIVSRIQEKDGNVVFRAKPASRQVIKDTTAYEIHSCLSEVLERGTADKAFSQFGLKKFPLGGKTGTAYNFTDAWFLGYSSAVTCGVWIGFDAPRTTIYRGAFSNEVALPVWVDVMNSTLTRYPAKEIAVPAGLKRVEICRDSGFLATNRCVDLVKDKATGETVQQRTTFFELATNEQMPKQFCPIHGDNPQAVAGITPQSPSGRQQWPRALPAVDASEVTAVQLKGPTVLGDDPYAIVKPAQPLEAPQTSGTAATLADAGKKTKKPKEAEPVEVRRAEPVRPADSPAQTPLIKIDPPPSLQF